MSRQVKRFEMVCEDGRIVGTASELAGLDTQNLYLPIEFLELLWAVPAAEVVQAPVRCSDCRFYDKRDGGAPGGTGWCSRPGAGCGVPEGFFCAGAERKEADNV